MKFTDGDEAVVLGVLAAGPLHGYEIARKIVAGSSKLLKLGESRLYPVLHEAEERGLVQAEWVPQAGKPARKVYALTDAGRARLEHHRSAWRHFSSSLDHLLGVAKPQEARGA